MHCVFIDFAKAFDSVAHERLLIKLKYFGVNGALLTWFRSFLTTCRQRVVINGKFSDWQYVLSGVPQCSIISWAPSYLSHTLMIFPVLLIQMQKFLLMVLLCILPCRLFRIDKFYKLT